MTGKKSCAAAQTLAVLVRQRRAHRGLRAISEETGVSVATICRVEQGKTPDLETFRKLCVWLGVSADSVLGLSPVNLNVQATLTRQEIRRRVLAVLDEGEPPPLKWCSVTQQNCTRSCQATECFEIAKDRYHGRPV